MESRHDVSLPNLQLSHALPVKDENKLDFIKCQNLQEDSRTTHPNNLTSLLFQKEN